MKTKRFGWTRADFAFDNVNTILMSILLIVMAYPLWYVLIASFSEPFAIARGEVFIIPKEFTLEAYTNVFKIGVIWDGYLNSFFYTIFGSILNMILTIPAAYVLSKKKLPGRALIVTYFLIIMYFGGGLIPTYLNIKSLNLIDKPYTLIVLSGISIYYVILTRVFYESTIPEELYESAHIDGASEFRSFFQIALPLSAPIIAVIALFYAVFHWNDYFTALLYVPSTRYHPLQLILRSILILNESMLNAVDSGNLDSDQIAAIARRAHMAEAMKYSLIFIASAPMLIAYPFVQKYFVKGVMIGSLKG